MCELIGTCLPGKSENARTLQNKGRFVGEVNSHGWGHKGDGWGGSGER